MRGRKTKPTHLKIVTGNPGHRPLNENEPQPAKVMPECPSHLDTGAKKEWKRVAPMLFQIGVLSEIDGTMLATYCQLYSDWVKVSKEKKKKDFELVNGGRQNSLMLIQAALVKDIRSMCSEFGMTPSSRGRLQVPGGKKNNKWGDL
uniref:Putative terminase n=1 Tax=viral metagenome TaxID=1070528 RepID=A0A6M3KE66_9ZZZZ